MKWNNEAFVAGAKESNGRVELSAEQWRMLLDLMAASGEPANTLHTTTGILRARLPACSDAFVRDVCMALLDELDRIRDGRASDPTDWEMTLLLGGATQEPTE
jgi:hypothetical protein